MFSSSKVLALSRRGIVTTVASARHASSVGGELLFKEPEPALWRDARLASACCSTTLLMLGHGVLTPVIPLLCNDMATSMSGGGVFGGASVVGTALAGFGAARLLANVPTGVAADSVGRKPVLVGGAVLNALGCLGSALATDVPTLVLSRVVAGAGNACFLGATQVYLDDIAPPEKRARYIGANHAALLLGVTAGPLIGGLTAEVDLRAPFALAAALSAAAAAQTATTLSETLTKKTGFLTSLLLSSKPKKQSDQESVWSTMDSRWVAAGSAQATGFAVRQGGRNMLLALAASEIFGYSPTQLGLVFGGMALVDLVSVGPSAYLADRFPARYIAGPSLAGTALALALCSQACAQQLGHSPALLPFEAHDVFVFSIALWSFSGAWLTPSIPAYAASLAPPGRKALGIALFRSAGDVGFVTGPLAVGAVASAMGTPAAMTALSLAAASTALNFTMFAKSAVPSSNDATR